MTNQTTYTTKITAMLLGLALVMALTPALMAQGGPRGRGNGSGQAAMVEPVTAEEAQWLTYMREEEKLARDVYQQLYEQWGLSIFTRISASEVRHFNAIGGLLTRHGLTDPAENLPAGVYTDPVLMALYIDLMAKGTQSLTDALEVGVLIESTDIDDLETSLGSTDKLDIKRVYTNLLEGSLNHQEAFETNLEAVCLATAPTN